MYVKSPAKQRFVRICINEYMSQDNLIKLVSQGDEEGNGKGHIIWSHKNAKKLRAVKIEVKKFNPIAKKHTVYREKK